MRMLGAKAFLGFFPDIFYFPEGFFLERTRSGDEVQNDKQSWII